MWWNDRSKVSPLQLQVSRYDFEKPSFGWVFSLGYIVANALLLLAILAAAWLAYQPGLTGGLHFDDVANLGGLGSADSALLMADFVLSGQAGPTGRPFSLASFALQRDLWPEHVEALIHTNVVLHLAAAVFVFLTARGLATALLNDVKWSDRAALLTTALWVFSPLLASAPLMLVQRMTVLSGLFVFMAMALYTWSRLYEKSYPIMAKRLMYFGLPVAFLTAVLSKENGILIAPLILGIEYLVLRRVACLAPVERRVEYALLVISGVIAVHLAAEIPNLMREGWRGYSPLERLLVQPSVLIDYIQGIFFPQVSNVSPYSSWDDLRSRDVSLNSYIGVVLVGGLIVGCVLLRKRYPMQIFFVTSFLVAHSIESSFVYLEPYFSHRNYVPAFFLFMMVGVGVASVSNKYRKLVLFGSMLFACSTLLVLYSGTTLWGDRMLAAEMWHRYFPQSERAAHALANQYVEAGDYQTALAILDDLEEQSGRPGLYKAQTLLLCQTSREDVASRVDDVVRGFSEGPGVRGVSGTIELITSHATKRRCETLTLQDARRIAESVLSGRAYRYDKDARAKAFVSLALVAAEEGNYRDMYSFIDAAFNERKVLDIGLLRVNMHISRREFEGARVYLHRLEESAPSGILKNTIWVSRIREWSDIIDGAESSVLGGSKEAS